MNFRKLKTSVAIAALMTAPLTANALTIEVNENANDLASALFLAVPGLNITSSTLSLSGDNQGAGLFENESGTYGLPNSGIVISSGNVSEYGDSDVDNEGGFGGGGEGGEFPGEGGEFPVATVANFALNTVAPLTPEAIDTKNSSDQELLGPITGQSSHFDVVRLDIDFEAAEDVSSVTFFATFGSEEFPNFVNSSFQDGFGLYVNGINVAGVQPSTGGPDNLPVNISHPDFDFENGTELNGVLQPNGNPVLQFDAPVIAGGTNNFTIILGDASDSALDTTTYISSFIPTVIVDPGTGEPGTGNPVVNDGGTEFTPLLPSNPQNPETGAFVIELPVVEGGIFNPETTIWVDPPVSIGYTYSVSGGALIASISAPSGATVPDSDGYTVTANGITVNLAVGQTATIQDLFGVAGVSFIEVGGIDESLMLDPLNTMAFPFGLGLSGSAIGASVTITPVTDIAIAPVPLPAGAALYLSGLAFAGFAGRRLQKARKS